MNELAYLAKPHYKRNWDMWSLFWAAMSITVEEGRMNWKITSSLSHKLEVHLELQGWVRVGGGGTGPVM